MSIHKWRRLPTQHFGEVWVPFAQISLRAVAGDLHTLLLQIDSGAVISLLGRSIADLLGVQLESGRRVELSGVGGSTTTAWMHEIDTVFARPHPQREPIRARVRYAIATHDEVPNLLGRLDVFDRLQFDFDPSLTETALSPPWLDTAQRRIYEFLLDTDQYVLARWNLLELPDQAREALRRLLNRMGQLYGAVLGLLKLGRTHSCPLYVRTMFETWLQLEYLLRDPEERGKLYLEFEHITRHRQATAIAENPRGWVSEQIAQSPMRAEGEARNRREYDRVRNLFEYQTRNGRTKVANNWYKMPIAELAESLGFDGEYRLIYSTCSAWAHADPSRTHDPGGRVFSDLSLVFGICGGYYARTIRSIANAGQLILTNEQHRFLEEFSVPMQ
jgi:hypothetical protein